MADLSEYRIFEGVEFRDEVKTLMQIFADSWYECRKADCSQCKYRHGKEQYTLVACLSERYAEKLIAADVAPVRHGNWDSSGKYMFANGELAIRCSECGCSLRQDEYKAYHWNYCPVCGAKMDGGGD